MGRLAGLKFFKEKEEPKRYKVPSEHTWEVPFYTLMSNYEENLLRRALTESGGNVARAGRLCGVRRTSMVEKMNKFNLKREDFK